MFENFELEGRGKKITGYSFECDSPEHVVIIIHGIGEHAGRYLRMAEHFAEKGIATLSMDLRGHGKTEGKRGHCAPRIEVLRDIDALIEYAEAKYPGLPITMYGHSMGGNITLDYRSRGRLNALPSKYIISAPWIKLVKPVTGALLSVVKLMSKLMPDKAISSNCEEVDLGNLLYVRPYSKDPLVHPYISFLTAYEGFTKGNEIMAGTNEDNEKAMATPLLIMHGTADKICDIEGTREFARIYGEKLEKKSLAGTMEYIEWEGYYHEIHNGGPDGQTGEEVINTAIEYILRQKENGPNE